MTKSKRTAKPLGLAMLASFGLWATATHASCVTGSAPGEAQVQDYLNALAPGANQSLDCVANDQTWQTTSSSAPILLLFEFAGYAPVNTFGIYDPANSAMNLQIFSGADSASAIKTLNGQSVSGGYSFKVNDGAPVTFASNTLGFYLQSPQGVFYSEIVRNLDGLDHLISFKLPSPNSFLLGWEDLYGGGDHDFNDMGVTVTGVAPVPLPAALWLMLSGVLGVATVARRRKRVALAA